jgi:hypothetical protein
MPALQFLWDLPAELIGMLAAVLDDEDLLAVRATCRELRDGCAFEFCQRYLDFVEISGTHDSVQRLLAILTSPSLPHARQAVRKLVVSAPLLGPPEDHQGPSTTDVARLLRMMPNLRTTKLADDTNLAESLCEAKSAPIFLVSLTQLHSQVRRLDLFAVQVDDDLLANTLEAHSSDLLIVSFNLVTLDSLLAW